MRPKMLEIEGLQSFKSLQVINFEHLGETGLFGIFGPTGSGKSTILDAITFALYGKVKRAERGTQGIINMDCKNARVSFTFELLKKGQRKTYRVDRAYQRKKNSENLCEPKVVRLIEMTLAGELPLCDKATEVSNQVEALLGLNHEDFTRAVVLPQNSFQEFLLLDNAKKRNMLERIFYLEEYGKGILDKIQRKMSCLKSEKDQLNGQIKAYEDASPEALKLAKEKKQLANQARLQIEKLLKKLEIEYKEAAQLWQYTEEMSKLNLRQAKLNQAKELMDNNKLQLAQAIKADSLDSRIKQVKWSADKLKESQLALEELSQKLPQAKDQLEQVKEALLKLREQSTAKQPGLVERKTRLSEGLTLAKELEAINLNLQQIRNLWAKQNTEIKVRQKEINTKEELLKQATEEFERIDQKLQAAKVSPEYRQILQQGLELENQLISLRSQATQLDNENEIISKKVEQQQATQSQTLENLTKAKIEQTKWQKLMLQQEAEIQANAAYALALTLQEQQPCPVCGALEHPAPATGHAQGPIQGPEQEHRQIIDNTAKQALEKANEEYQNIEKQQLQQQAELAYLKEQQSKLQTQIQKQTEALQQAESAHLSFSTTNQINDSFKASTACLVKKDQAAWELQKQQSKLQTNLEKLRVEIQTLQQASQKIEQELVVTKTQGSSLNQQKLELDNKLTELTKGNDIEQEIKNIEEQLEQYTNLDKKYQEQQLIYQENYDQLAKQNDTYQNQERIYQESLNKENKGLEQELTELGFANITEVLEARLSQTAQSKLGQALTEYEQETNQLAIEKKLIETKLAGKQISLEQWQKIETEYQAAHKQREEAFAYSESTNSHFKLIESRHEKWLVVQAENQKVNQQFELHDQIQKLLKGDRNKDNSFIDYIAEERLRYVALKASETLGAMTQYKYGLELDIQMGFIIRDNANGGIHRAVSTLSGGEVFLTSLALALALSEQIQLKGQSPLEFFFLDEGFGTLDSDLLDSVMDALESLSSQSRMIGLISHVPEMRCRMERRLMVEPPNIHGIGSQVRLEKA